MTAPDPLALALRELRGSPATDAAGHDDAEDADALRSALREMGWEVVPEAMMTLLRRWAALDGGAWHPVRYANEKAELLADTCAALAQQEPSP